MNLSEIQDYILPVAIVAFFGWRFFKFKKIKQQLPWLIQKGAVVVDVRTPSEYQQGSRPGSINIPLNDLGSRISELDKNKPVVLCCASGSRSGMAASILRKNGFREVLNAGPWTNTIN
jgi:rhodanese-related sulfurtransferase